MRYGKIYFYDRHEEPQSTMINNNATTSNRLDFEDSKVVPKEIGDNHDKSPPTDDIVNDKKLITDDKLKLSFNNTYVDDDLCSNCRRMEDEEREQHRAKQSLDQIIMYDRIRQQNNVRDAHRIALEQIANDEKNKRQQTRALYDEIDEINRQLIEAKKVEKLKMDESSKYSNGYILQHRLDTPPRVNIDQQTAYKLELNRQIEAKRDEKEAERQRQLNDYSQLNYAIGDRVNRENETRQKRDNQTKDAYRQALDTQIANKRENNRQLMQQMKDSSGSQLNIDELSLKKYPIVTMLANQESQNMIDNGDQRRRVARQELAFQNLIEFKLQLDATDLSARRRRRRMTVDNRLTTNDDDRTNNVGVYRSKAPISTNNSVVFDAWSQAHALNRRKYDILQDGNMASNCKSIDESRRCRRCRRLLSDHRRNKTIYG